jgi:catechol 2,3-dioxygenase-like lactoylglutathione lyase family enzyme
MLECPPEVWENPFIFFQEKHMLGYVMLGTNDLPRAAKFYDVLCAEVGGKRLMETDRFIAWSDGKGAGLSVVLPDNGEAATVGNGVMAAIAVESRAKVDAMHKKALELGGTDEGAVGERGTSGFYAGYFRDLDGNKLNIFTMPQPA